MRHIAIVAAAAAALVSTSAFAAGVPATTAKQQNAAITSVNVKAAQPATGHRSKVNARELATQFNGTYKLTNGSEIALSSRNARYYASMGGEPVEMLAVDRNSFVSADAKLAVSFASQAVQGDDIAVTFAN